MFGRMSSKSFTSLHNPNWNSLMNVASLHQILEVKCLNYDACTTVEYDHWQKDRNLMLNMHYLPEFLKVALNFSINVSKSLSKGD
jgi:hypothetical protein